MLKIFEPLQSAQFRKYFTAAVLSALGDGMQMIAMSWFLYHKTESVAAVSAILIIQTLPGLFLSPVAGALVDRWSTKRVCVAADASQGLILVGLVLAIQTDRWVLPAIYTASFLLAVCRLFFSPALGALVRDISTKDALLSANILSSTTLQAGMLCGASLGGFLVAAIGATSVMLINAVSFFVSSVLTAWIRTVPRETAAEHANSESGEGGDGGEAPSPHLLRELREALGYARRHPFILWLTVVDIFDTMAINVFTALLPAFVSRELQAGPEVFGMIEGAWGGGALLGGFLLSHVARRVGQHAISVAGPACLSLLMVFFLTSQSTAHAVAGYFVLGVFVCAVGINTNTLLASEVAPAYFGKVKSFIYMCTSYVGLAVYGLLSVLGDRVSPRWILGTVSGLIMAGFLCKLLQVYRRGGLGQGSTRAC